MSQYSDQQLTPAADRHGEFVYPISGPDALLYGDQHGVFAYPINSSGDVHPAADNHINDQFVLHVGQPKPGSFKEQQTPRPKQPPVLGS